MREIRTSGSEGGGVEPNRRSLPLLLGQIGTGLRRCDEKGDEKGRALDTAATSVSSMLSIRKVN